MPSTSNHVNNIMADGVYVQHTTFDHEIVEVPVHLEKPTEPANGTRTVFTFKKDILDASETIYKGHVAQEITSDYTVSKNKVTFLVAPINGISVAGTYRYLKPMDGTKDQHANSPAKLKEDAGVSPMPAVGVADIRPIQGTQSVGFTRKDVKAYTVEMTDDLSGSTANNTFKNFNFRWHRKADFRRLVQFCFTVSGVTFEYYNTSSGTWVALTSAQTFTTAGFADNEGVILFRVKKATPGALSWSMTVTAKGKLVTETLGVHVLAHTFNA